MYTHTLGNRVTENGEPRIANAAQKMTDINEWDESRDESVSYLTATG